MKFNKIKWKNLLSYGNKIQEYEFTDKPKLVLIEGENGAGKSSIKEALTISTYGKSALRKMKDIPNWLNKSAYTYNEFTSNKGDTIIIERGIDPNFSQIKINDVPYNLPDKRKIDEFIENELIGLNFSIFCNTISLSFDDFKSFVSLNASDKRKIIDPMFGIDILADMKVDIKEDLKSNKRELDIINSNISKNEQTLERSIDQLKQLRQKLKEASEVKTAQITTEIEAFKGVIGKHQDKYKEIKQKIQDIRDKAAIFRDKTITAKNKISEYDSKLKLYEKNRCPHCLSDLTGQASIDIKDTFIEKRKTETEFLSKVAERQAKVTELVNKLTTEQNIEKDKFYNIQADIKRLETELAKALEETQDDQEGSITNIIESIKEDIKGDEANSKQYVENLELFGLLDEVLSDSGIKRSLIDRVIPLLNNRIAEISDRLEFKFSFSFDNEFNPIITYLGMDVAAESLSTGQRKKMNLIVLLSFIELIKMKHTNMNTMFLDEIFSGLDKKNVYMAIEILREYADKYNMTIFVVSHESLPEEFFDERIMVTMPNHFSEIEITSNIHKELEPTQ